MHLANSNAKFKQMLSTVGVHDKALQAMNGIILVPSNAAVDAFASSMGMTLQQLLSNKNLVDQITAYHFLPNVSIKKDLQVPNMPMFTKTGEFLMTVYDRIHVMVCSSASLAATGSTTLAPAAAAGHVQMPRSPNSSRFDYSQHFI